MFVVSVGRFLVHPTIIHFPPLSPCGGVAVVLRLLGLVGQRLLVQPIILGSSPSLRFLSEGMMGRLPLPLEVSPLLGEMPILPMPPQRWGGRLGGDDPSCDLGCSGCRIY